jgi:N utilization substance protein A
MSREILEAVRQIEKENGIEDETLVRALEDALLAAYKKTPGAARHAQVELDRVSGDFRVWSIELPSDVEERLLDEARERAIIELEAVEAENGIRFLRRRPVSTGRTSTRAREARDVTPAGRIAAQTAKLVSCSGSAWPSAR